MTHILTAPHEPIKVEPLSEVGFCAWRDIKEPIYAFGATVELCHR